MGLVLILRLDLLRNAVEHFIGFFLILLFQLIFIHFCHLRCNILLFYSMALRVKSIPTLTHFVRQAYHPSYFVPLQVILNQEVITCATDSVKKQIQNPAQNQIPTVMETEMCRRLIRSLIKT